MVYSPDAMLFGDAGIGVGIATGIATGIAEEGAHVSVNDINARGGESTAAAIKANKRQRRVSTGGCDPRCHLQSAITQETRTSAAKRDGMTAS